MIPVNEPLIGALEQDYVVDCISTGWISSAGKYIEQFENKWAEYCGRKYGVAVCNGTVALELALSVLDLPAGGEVILPSFTIVSCLEAVLRNNLMPVLVDCDPRTYCMDVGQVEARITPKTVAVMPVHIYGHPVDMNGLLAVARKHGLKIIEDAAEAHGAEVLVSVGSQTNTLTPALRQGSGQALSPIGRGSRGSEDRYLTQQPTTNN